MINYHLLLFIKYGAFFTEHFMFVNNVNKQFHCLWFQKVLLIIAKKCERTTRMLLFVNCKQERAETLNN